MDGAVPIGRNRFNIRPDAMGLIASDTGASIANLSCG
jgi:hypothetical protein